VEKRALAKGAAREQGKDGVVAQWAPREPGILEAELLQERLELDLDWAQGRELAGGAVPARAEFRAALWQAVEEQKAKEEWPGRQVKQARDWGPEEEVELALELESGRAQWE